MKRTYCMEKLIIAAVTVSIAAILFMPSMSLAKKAQDVKIVLSAALYPEFGEWLGLNMYFSALEGRARKHPDLKNKVKIKLVDKGTLCGSQDECLTMVSIGAAQMTYSGPHFLEQLMPEWRLGEFPGLFDNWSHYLRSMNTPAWRELHQ